MFHLLLTIDPFLGKIDKSTLSQQTLMELFVEKIDNKEKIYVDATDISTWGTPLWGLNTQNGEVIRITFYNGQLCGSVQLEWLPFSVVLLNCGRNDFLGTVNLESLPDRLEKIFLSMNRFDGTVCLTSLPESLRVLDLNDNQFFGTVDLTKLPKEMRKLILRKNRFADLAQLTQLSY